VKPKSRHKIKKSEVKRIADKIKTTLNIDISPFLKDKNIEIAEFEGHTLLLINGKPSFFLINNKFIPTLKGIVDLNIQQPRVVVDSGAVRFIANGADVMGPGIIEADENIQIGSITIITEERHGKPLAIGEALKTGTDMPQSTGKAVKSIHYVGDKVWNLEL
jgi:PUA domain protein